MAYEPFSLHGEVDAANAHDVLSRLRSAAALRVGDVVVDCAHLAFIAAAGIDTLTIFRNELAREGRALYLAHASPFLARVLAVLDLTKLLVPDSIAEPPRRSSDESSHRELYWACADTRKRANRIAAAARETMETSNLIRERVRERSTPTRLSA